MSIKVKHVPYLSTEELERLLLTSNNDAIVEAIEHELELREEYLNENFQEDTPSLTMPSYSS